MLTRDDIGRSWRSWLSKDGVDPGPWWLAYVWTLVFCVVVAAGFTVLGYAISVAHHPEDKPQQLWRWYQANLMVSLIIGYTIHFMFAASIRVVGRERLRKALPWQRTLFFSLVPVIAVAIAWPLAMLWMLGVDIRRWLSMVPGNVVVASVLMFALITFVFHQFFRIKTRQIQAENRATEAQLRLLQAQIEPHFLFNTLANVVSLMEGDTPRAKAMLESFVDYLRASLSGLGRLDDGRHTLGDELALVAAYLRILQTRMEDRLSFSIDVPDELRATRLPPLTVQPLVENAVVHGLEPTIAGGRVSIRARREGERIVVTVADDGAGLDAARTAPAAGSDAARPGRGAGTALANIRARLRQAYGPRASLELGAAAPRGTEARLALPVAA